MGQIHSSVPCVPITHVSYRGSLLDQVSHAMGDESFPTPSRQPLLKKFVVPRATGYERAANKCRLEIRSRFLAIWCQKFSKGLSILG